MNLNNNCNKKLSQLIRNKRKQNKRAGFTLIEVMIALTIMTIAFGAILTSQSGSILLTSKTKDLNVAGWLAQRIITESEHVLEGKSFAELPEQAGEAFTAPFDRFSWKREIKEVKFPDLIEQEPTNNNRSENSGVSEAARILSKTLTKYFNDAVREMTVTITWHRGASDHKIEITTYLIDLDAEFNFSI